MYYQTTCLFFHWQFLGAFQNVTPLLKEKLCQVQLLWLYWSHGTHKCTIKVLWVDAASYKCYNLGQEVGPSVYACKGKNLGDTLRALPQSPSFHAESKEQAKHLVEERIHCIPDAIAGKFMGEWENSTVCKEPVKKHSDTKFQYQH